MVIIFLAKILHTVLANLRFKHIARIVWYHSVLPTDSTYPQDTMQEQLKMECCLRTHGLVPSRVPSASLPSQSVK